MGFDQVNCNLILINAFNYLSIFNIGTNKIIYEDNSEFIKWFQLIDNQLLIFKDLFVLT